MITKCCLFNIKLSTNDKNCRLVRKVTERHFCGVAQPRYKLDAGAARTVCAGTTGVRGQLAVKPRSGFNQSLVIVKDWGLWERPKGEKQAPSFYKHLALLRCDAHPRNKTFENKINNARAPNPPNFANF